MYDGGLTTAGNSSNGVKLELLKLKGKTVEDSFLPVEGIWEDDIAEYNLSNRLRSIYLLLFYDFGFFNKFIDSSWAEDSWFYGRVIRAELKEVKDAEEGLKENSEELIEEIARSCHWDWAEISAFDALQPHDKANANQNIEDKIEEASWEAKLYAELM